MMGGPKGGFGRQLKFWQAGAGAGGEQIVPILSIAALVGATLAAEVTEVDAALFDAPAVTALAEVTPVPVPPEAISLPPPHEAKTVTLAAQIKRRCKNWFIGDNLVRLIPSKNPSRFIVTLLG
jgi:hypothetical protein